MSAARWHWWPFALVVVALGAVTAVNITLPGVYMDAVNPDYMVVRLLNPRSETLLPWLLPGNWLFDRAPVMISFYHGSQQVWLGLPFFWLFGTDVVGLRLTHAVFALGVLAALYAFLGRAGLRPWQAALACMALAVDPGFSYAFRTQSYITMAPAAWLFLALYSLARAGSEDSASPGRWLFASGLFYGLALVGYFVYAFFLPALILAVRWYRVSARTRAAWRALILGTLVGAVPYPIGYALAVRHLGGIAPAWDYFQQTQRAINAFSEQVDFAARVSHLAANVQSVFYNWYHHSLIFGEYQELPGAHYRTALLIAGPMLAWAWAEWRRQSPLALRVLVVMGVSFVLVAAVFGTRLSGHHFMVLLPIAYAALALALLSLVKPGPAWRSARWAFALPFAALLALNAGGQVKEGARLAEVRGVGLYSDAINRLAADLDASPHRPFAYLPDWGLLMPVVLLTGGRIGVDSLPNYAAGTRLLCQGRDVAVAIVTGDRAARIAQWQHGLRWDAPQVTPYRQSDGTVVFDLALFRGRRDAQACKP